MCGISGFFSTDAVFSRDELISMTDALMHRGPDACGYYFDGLVGLGHRRLSIIDVSSAANQPMYSSCGNYAIIYNGEVYNFNEIKDDILKEKKINFKTASDTEVILEAFVLWGKSFVHKLNGMFAIAIYDIQKQSLYLFRDRIGIKPIYYFSDGKNFAFASELKSLLKLNWLKKDLLLNYEAINTFLHLGYIPEPLSVYKNIFKFPSGNFAVISNNNVQITPYWELTEKFFNHPITDENEARQTLKDLMISSVNYRMISDVPFGTFLSGGIDSSVVTAIAQSLSGQPVKTFSIGFEDTKHNESLFAKNVAEYLGTNHHEFTVLGTDARQLIPTMLELFDEPFADSSAIPTMLVSKLARQNVTMTLSGDGGDELFLGYGAYQWASRLRNPVLNTMRKPMFHGLSLMGDKYRRAAHLFDFRNNNYLKSHIFSQEQYLFKRNEITKLLRENIFREIKEDEQYDNLQLSPVEAQALFDIKHYLKDDLLVKVDRASMAYSLETRVPLLDYRIVEFAVNLPENLRKKGNNTKYLLKKVLFDYIPEDYFNRPKWGFSIPLSKWLKSDLKYLVDDYLSEDMVNKQGIINYKIVKNLKNLYFEKNHNYLYNRLWLLVVLNSFLDRER